MIFPHKVHERVIFGDSIVGEVRGDDVPVLPDAEKHLILPVQMYCTCASVSGIEYHVTVPCRIIDVDVEEQLSVGGLHGRIDITAPYDCFIFLYRLPFRNGRHDRR